VEVAMTSYHVKRHADGEWVLYCDGEIVGTFDTYAEAMERMKIEMSTIEESTDVTPPI
jgi:hypothetical protein